MSFCRLKFVIMGLLSLVVSTTSFAATSFDKDSQDQSALRKLNMEIAAAEDRGDHQWLANILASELAFRRANGVVVGKAQFISDVKARKESKTEVESITFYGKDRAVVTCIVTLKIDGKDVAFHNVRLFIREETGWKLLGWANERLTTK